MKDAAHRPQARTGDAATTRPERADADRRARPGVALPPSLVSRDTSREAEADILGRRVVGDPAFTASVRVHDDAHAHDAAAARGARAFARGSDIYFGRGQRSDARLAHELGHVVQQRRDRFERIDRDQDPHSTPMSRESAFTEIRAAMKRSVTNKDPFWLDLKDGQVLGDQMLMIDPVVPDKDQVVVAKAYEEGLLALLPQPYAEIELAGDDQYEWVDMQMALDLITEQLGSEELTELNLPSSFGTDTFMWYLGEVVAGVAVDLASDVRTAYHAYDPSKSRGTLDENLAAVVSGGMQAYVDRLTKALDEGVQTWGDPFGLLELELQGALIWLNFARAEFKKATDEPTRAHYGKMIGHIARRILILDLHLVPLTQRLERRLDGERVAAIGDTSAGLPAKTIMETVRHASQTEESTLHVRDDKRSELGTHGIGVDLPLMVKQATFSVITPEEAYPAYTDAAVLAGQKDLAERVEKERTNLDGLKGELVPASITSYDQFATVYRDWLSFWSRTSRDTDPLYQFYSQLMGPIVPLLGMAGASGWLGTMWLANMVGENIPIGHADASSLAEETQHRVPLRSLDVTKGNVIGKDGSSGISFQTATLAPASGASMSFESEVSGREQNVTKQSQVSQESFREVYRTKQDERLPVLARQGLYRKLEPGPTHLWENEDPNNVHGFSSDWSYLLAHAVLDPATFEETVHFEHKQARTKLASYLLAQTQYYKTAAHDHYLTDESGTNIGDEETRTHGLEAGTASASLRYLQGRPEGTVHDDAYRYQGRIKSAVDGIKGHQPGQLVRDLEKTLSTFFKNGEPVERVRAILLIAMEQNDLEKQVLEKFSYEALRKAITFVAAIAGALWGLSMLGQWGQLAAVALRKALKKVGLKADINSVVLIGTWATNAASTVDFSGAQRQAFVGAAAGAELAELLRDEALGLAMKATGSAAKWAFGKLVLKPENIKGSDFKDLFGKDGIGKEASWELEQSLREKLDGGARLDKDAIQLLKDTTPDVYKRLRNDYPEAFGGRKGPVTDFAPGSAPGEMKALIDAELPPELAAQCRVVEVPGKNVRVKVEGGKLVVEVGKSVRRDPAGSAILAGHIGTLKRYAPFAGQLGRIRYFLAKVGAYVGLDTAASKSGEAAEELAKLAGIRKGLSELRTRAEKNLDGWTRDPGKASQTDLDLELKNIEDQIKFYEGELGKTGIGKGWIAAEGVKNNFADVEPMLGKPLDDKGRAALEALGYRFDVNGVIYRPEGVGDAMVPLSTKGGTLQMTAYESPSAVQARIRASLTPDEVTKLQEIEKVPLPAGTKRVLVEGVHDTGATWKQILGGPKNAAKRAELKSILMDHGGLSEAKADELINGLVNRGGNIQVVFGTDPIRDAYDYRGNAKTATGDIAHHFDPLYLGGGHKLIANLPAVGPKGADVHGMVHDFFNNLTLPDLPSVSPRNTRLSPKTVQSAVPGGARPVVVYIVDGEVTFTPL